MINIARDNPTRAVSFIRELRSRCREIADFPRAAPLRPELGDEIRLVAFKAYVILYVAGDDMVEIQRVVHGARDLTDAGLL